MLRFKGDFSILIKNGYRISVNNSYLFKVVDKNDAIFIDIQNRQIIVEGDIYSDEVIKELKSIKKYCEERK